MSFRHQDSITKVTQNGELMWIMGINQGYRAQFQDKVLDMECQRPFFHQHDITITSNGDLMLLDNGAAGSFPSDPRQPLDERETFALNFSVDEMAMTATETWRYGGKGNLPYSHYVSGVCEMPNGNRFIACSGIKIDADGNYVELPPHGRGSIELIEVTKEGEQVFHAKIEAPDDPVEKGWNGFRPEYLAPDMADLLGR